MDDLVLGWMKDPPSSPEGNMSSAACDHDVASSKIKCSPWCQLISKTVTCGFFLVMSSYLLMAETMLITIKKQQQEQY